MMSSWALRPVIMQWTLRQRDFETSCGYRREFSRLLSETLGCDSTSDCALELVFGELVTNAVRYGDEPMSVWVDISGRTARIVVENAGSCATPEVHVASPSSEGGRGLSIVRSLVTRLQIERTPEVACRITAVMPLRTLTLT